MLYAIDSEILETLLEGISCKKYVEITTLGKKKSQNKKEVYPIKIYVSTQNGREYLACHETGCSGLSFIRLDNIKTARLKKYCEANQQYENEYIINKQYLWGVITGNAKDILHIEITIYVGENDEFILHRLEREKRNGHIYKVNDVNYKYVVDTYDAMELMPWIRTFIGRVVKIESSNPELEKKFKEDMSILYSMYLGGDDDVVQ